MASTYITQKQSLAHLLMCPLLIMYNVHTSLYCELQNMCDFMLGQIRTYMFSNVFC